MKKETFFITGLIVCFVFMSTVVFAAEGITLKEVADAIAKMLISGRAIIAENQELINTHNATVINPSPEGQPQSFKGFVPALFGMFVSKRFYEDSGIRVKQTTRGRGVYKARNEYNIPDEWEADKLLKFEEGMYERDTGYGEVITKGDIKTYRYVRPLYIEESCLKCHGDPMTSHTKDGKDISGRQMEGYQVGELRGGISVTIFLRE
ncbi:MAG: DUF3365 domain-containing protein [PVC group bacterium]|nr:DUF3365 domain-containing protein [PVC group bacterium]